MRVKSFARKACAIATSVALVVYVSGTGGAAQARTNAFGDSAGGEVVTDSETLSITGDSDENISLSAGNKEKKEKETYIIKTKTKADLSKIRAKFPDSEGTNNNSEEHLSDNKMVSVELSGGQAESLVDDANVQFIETDKIVTASSNSLTEKKPAKEKVHSKDKRIHTKKVKKLKKNTSSIEWNVRMINAEDKITQDGPRVKVAVLDSGIDWGNDINLVYQVSLVPGEEEMTQVFMDGSGHGSSVASLIAANDDGEGITGINPNVDIYSYRVLGDGNCAPVSRVVEAIYMAIEQNVNIINMSFGLDDYSEALEEAIHAAKKAGILIVAAAGNTGEGGVQYPAAFDEVIAVGAVNKDGTVEDYSAKGEEVEIVAPGELVNTTGFLGTEEVTSGTSLSAPQVTAIATLIWQKDLSVSADFVRGLLDESANLYGNKESYGNGLADAEYALSHYEEYKEQYEKANKKRNEVLISENENEIVTFEDTGCVKGSWKTEKHAELITGTTVNVRRGARLPDIKLSFKTAGINPWWHGFYEQNQGEYRTSNYIQAVFTITSIADAVGKNGITQYDSLKYKGYNKSERAGIIEDLEALDWKNELTVAKKELPSQTDSKGFRRALIWGMAIHSATDIYAHSACVNNVVIGHEKSKGVPADDWDYIKDRNVCATRAAKQMMTAYLDKRELDIYDVIPLRKFNGFTLKSLAAFAKAFDSNLNGVIYDYGYSYSYSHSSK